MVRYWGSGEKASHFSHTWATEPSALRWALIACQGTSGSSRWRKVGSSPSTLGEGGGVGADSATASEITLNKVSLQQATLTGPALDSTGPTHAEPPMTDTSTPTIFTTPAEED